MLAHSDAILCLANSSLLLTASVDLKKHLSLLTALSRADHPREDSQEAKFFTSNSRRPTHNDNWSIIL